MTIHSNRTLRRDLETIFHAGTLAGLTDGELLERFVSRRASVEAEAAFSVLIERHGPMVLRVCQGVLGDPHEADDAFQATFLVLLRQAGAIRQRESVGPWLHGVAHRVASCARSAAARRRLHERRSSERRRDAACDPLDLDLPAVIHAELGRLPERFRAPIVLCDLEERSLDEAARQLGWPLGTIKSRLNRGRQRLRDRLVRRGVAPGIALMRWGDTAVPVRPALAEATARITTAGAASVPAAVLAMVEGVGRTVLMGRLKLAAAGAIVLGMSAIGIGALAGGPPRATQVDAVAAGAAQQPAKAAPGVTGRAAPSSKRGARRADGSSFELVDITGRAIDSSGRPIAGATVYVIDVNNGRREDENPLLATVATDPDGRFIARGVELPISKLQPSPMPGVAESRFQLAGTAPGFGFSWHPAACFRPAGRPASAGRKNDPAADEPEAFYRGETIVIHLTFGPPASLRGKVGDDRGRPLTGALVQVGVCDDPQMPARKVSRCMHIDPNDRFARDNRTFYGIGALPEAMFTTRTGPDGTYRIDGLPRETLLLLAIAPGPAYEPLSELIATTSERVQDASQAGFDIFIREVHSLGHDGVYSPTFVGPREARFTLKYRDTDQPARNATVRAGNDRTLIRAGVGVTDAQGRATLQLRSDEYAFVIEPPFGAPYLPARGAVRVGKQGITQVGEIALEPAAVVVLEARDAKTRRGIKGVSFQYVTGAGRGRRGLSSQPWVADHPATDERGDLRAVVEPGPIWLFVATVPAGWTFEGSPGNRLDLSAGRAITAPAGKVTTVRFFFNEAEEPGATAGRGSALFPEDLVEKWRRVQGLPRSGKICLRQLAYSLRQRPISVDALEAFLDAHDLSQAPDPAAALAAGLPGLPKPDLTLAHEIIDDGRRRRDVSGAIAGPTAVTVAVSSEGEVVVHDSGDAQVGLYAANRGGHPAVFGLRGLSMVFGIPDFRTWPFIALQGNPASFFDGGVVRRFESGGRLTVEERKDHATGRWVMDSKTGFVRADSWRSTRPNVLGHLIRQYGPKALRDGVVLPTVHVEARLEGPQVHGLRLTIVDGVDLDYRPTPLDFVVAAPAGTMIEDHREDPEHPARAVTRYPVADVIAYACAMASRDRWIEPMAPVGRPAPPIKPASWLDRNGPAGPPDVTGKVVLIDFWGLSSAPSLAELPAVQAAADRFADRKDFIIIGMHESGESADRVAGLARERGLTYRLAVDRPAGGDGWSGTTFRSYGIRAIPAAAVIDRRGRAAFVGRLPEALEEAAKLLGQPE